jgi:RNA-directed DNA polymerase
MSNVNGESDVSPTESEATRTVGNNPRGSWEIPETSLLLEMDRSEKARCHNADMHGPGKSDSLVVPEKRANNAGSQTAAESVEERRLTKENASQPLLVRTQSRGTKSRGLQGVREIAREDKKARFNNLLNHITPELLQASFFDLKKSAAPGIDGETWAEYAENFEMRIVDLHTRIHRGTYRAQPSKRTWIPKLDGKLRPLGIAALEDKIVQQAVRVVLECIY